MSGGRRGAPAPPVPLEERMPGTGIAHLILRNDDEFKRVLHAQLENFRLRHWQTRHGRGYPVRATGEGVFFTYNLSDPARPTKTFTNSPPWPVDFSYEAGVGVAFDETFADRLTPMAQKTPTLLALARHALRSAQTSMVNRYANKNEQIYRAFHDVALRAFQLCDVDNPDIRNALTNLYQACVDATAELGRQANDNVLDATRQFGRMMLSHFPPPPVDGPPLMYGYGGQSPPSSDDETVPRDPSGPPAEFSSGEEFEEYVPQFVRTAEIRSALRRASGDAVKAAGYLKTRAVEIAASAADGDDARQRCRQRHGLARQESSSAEEEEDLFGGHVTPEERGGDVEMGDQAIIIKGLHLDPARRQLTADKVLDIVSKMAAAGFNTLHLHLTDDQGIAVQLDESREIPLHGRFAPWTFEEQRRIGDACRRHGIRVVPELGMPGHAVALKSFIRMLGDPTAPFTPSGAYGIKTPELITVDNSGKDELGAVLKMFDGLCDRFGLQPGDTVHMGGDELGGLNTAHRQPTDSMADPKHGSWNYVRVLVTRVCDWAARRGFKVIAWEDIFKRLLGYQANVKPGVPNVDIDMKVKKIVHADGRVEAIPNDDPRSGFQYRPSYTNAELAELVFRLPENLLMQTWIQNPTREWQRYVVPAERTIVSNGYYLDMMKPDPMDMFRAKMRDDVAGHIACTWGEWIGQENIDTVLYPTLYLLGSKFSRDGRSELDILEHYLDSTRLATETDTWKMREWVGFSSPDKNTPYHPRATPNAPDRYTPMDQAPENTYPAFSRFLVEYYVRVCRLLRHGTRVPTDVAERIEAQVLDASRDLQFSIPVAWQERGINERGQTGSKAAMRILLHAMLNMYSEPRLKERCELVKFFAGRLNAIKGTDSASNTTLGILYPEDVKEDPSVTVRNGLFMVHRGIGRFASRLLELAEQDDELES